MARAFLFALAIVLSVVGTALANDDTCSESESVSPKLISDYINSIDTTVAARKEMMYFEFLAIGNKVTVKLTGGQAYQLFVGQSCLPLRTANNGAGSCGGEITFKKDNIFSTSIKVGVFPCEGVTQADIVQATVTQDGTASCKNFGLKSAASISPDQYCAGCAVKTSLATLFALLCALALIL